MWLELVVVLLLLLGLEVHAMDDVVFHENEKVSLVSSNGKTKNTFYTLACSVSNNQNQNPKLKELGCCSSASKSFVPYEIGSGEDQNCIKVVDKQGHTTLYQIAQGLEWAGLTCPSCVVFLPIQHPLLNSIAEKYDLLLVYSSAQLATDLAEVRSKEPALKADEVFPWFEQHGKVVMAKEPIKREGWRVDQPGQCISFELIGSKSFKVVLFGSDGVQHELKRVDIEFISLDSSLHIFPAREQPSVLHIVRLEGEVDGLKLASDDHVYMDLPSDVYQISPIEGVYQMRECQAGLQRKLQTYPTPCALLGHSECMEKDEICYWKTKCTDRMACDIYKTRTMCLNQKRRCAWSQEKGCSPLK
jgi:hypothetical protein